ncbi:MAG: thiolase family protein [Spirochaetia bacterium]|jgi:acetyl-CoA C-acetyltransferase|uniref:Acetyl-CoA acetyltransferase n=2 Tax=root TaxID=1 RepID=A0A652ZT01_9SPIR|nr:thiolase family protein [Spirochaetia bacterium]NLX45846.1 thiolase family protein [Treponema sp.]VBB38910.1 Acetyl-CoA acetyltransferase [uncultured Spirochaetota bacterium]HAP54936.1 acetyl-CoA C-acyltransferase [Spirochaetaceae bacterium]HOI23496.1 thiolase family protein [Spirochaetales bacterium]
MNKVVIASAVRTAGGGFGGSFKNLTAVDLGAAVIKESLRRAGLAPEAVGQVIFGNGWQAGVGPNPARLCTVRSGLPVSCPAFTVNIRCASSLRAIELGALSIAAGEEEIVIAGGTESSTNVPYIIPGLRWGQRMGDGAAYDVLHRDGFMCSLAGMLMGNTAELLVEKYGISRKEQDEFSAESHIKALRAMEEGSFDEEVLALEVRDRKTTNWVKNEEIPRKDISLEKLGNLPPVFLGNGTITAGNSCALCDAASALVLMSERRAKELGVKPLAEIRSYSYVALDPKLMGLGPTLAIPAALKKAGLELGDIDLIELNEAFAAQVIACDRELKMDMGKLNVNGGAIALGHPVGATGAKILTTLLYALKKRDKNLGLVSLCIGGGQGVALIVERVN